MAMMAETNPALFRLFERIDSAPRPDDESLGALLEDWREKRTDVAIPLMSGFTHEKREARLQSYFLFATVADDRRDYVLRHGNDDIEAFLGTSETGARLKNAPDRQAAVRLRLLLDTVRSSGEPLLAQFEIGGRASRRSFMEILVAPLSEDGRSVAGFVCGLAARPSRGRSFLPVEHRKSADDPLIFAFDRDKAFAATMAGHLGLSLSPLEEREFEDGEHKVRPLIDVRGRHVYLVASLNAGEIQSVNDRLCRLLFLIGCLKTNGAAKISVATPYLCYLRKDRQTKPFDPLTGRYVAQLIEAVGADELIAMEAHNLAAFQNAFRIPTVHLTPYSAFAKHLLPDLGSREVFVVSPDLGGSKRADLFRGVLEEKLGRPVGAALIEKHRSMDIVSGDMFAGDVAGRTVVILDDMISSGTTMARAARACREHGAGDVYLAATHGVFSADAERNLREDAIRKILIANTAQPLRIPEGLRSRVAVVDVSDVFGRAIRPS